MTLYVNGVEVGGGGGGAPSGPAGGDLGGMYPDPTVTDLTIASEARGDLLRRGASAWQRVAAKTSGSVVAGDGTDVVSVPIATPLAVSPTANLVALGLLAQPDLNTGSVTNVGAGVGTLAAASFSVALPSGSAVNDGSSTTIAWPASLPLTFEMVFRAVFTGTSAGDRVARVYVNLGGSMAGHEFHVELDGNGNSTAKYDGSGTLGGGAIAPLPNRSTTWIRFVMNGNRVAVWASDTSVFGSAYVDNYTVLPSFGVTSAGYFSAATITLEGVNVTTTTDAATSVTIDNLTIRPVS